MKPKIAFQAMPSNRLPVFKELNHPVDHVTTTNGCFGQANGMAIHCRVAM
jgi:hypothetical protein